MKQGCLLCEAGGKAHNAIFAVGFGVIPTNHRTCCVHMFRLFTDYDRGGVSEGLDKRSWFFNTICNDIDTDCLISENHAVVLIVILSALNFRLLASIFHKIMVLASTNHFHLNF